MRRLVFTDAHRTAICAAIDTSPERETCIPFYGIRYEADDDIRYLVRRIVIPPHDAYDERSPVRASLKSAYVGQLVGEAKAKNAFFGFAHNHPHASVPTFSLADNDGERLLRPFLESRFGSSHHVSVIVGSAQWVGREIGQSAAPLEIVSVGSSIRLLSQLDLSDSHALDPIYDRQIRAFGPDGQRALRALRVAIVGAGGTGSVVAQQLAYLGVGHIYLVDFDTVDGTNLNRLVGALPNDVGRPKVQVVKEHLAQIAPNTVVLTRNEDVVNSRVALTLVSQDLIFSCTDSHGSRAVLNQLAYQYFVPCIDVGVGIHMSANTRPRIVGRVQMLAPGLGCLTCGNLLDAGQVRTDLMTPAERRFDPYFVGIAVEQPAVISINATVASLGVSMALAAVTEIPMHPRLSLYDGVHGVVRSATIEPVAHCVVCSEKGALGRGPNWDLPVRSSAGSGV